MQADRTLQNLKKLRLLRRERETLLKTLLGSAFLSGRQTYSTPQLRPLRVKFECGPQSFIAICPTTPVTRYKWLGAAARGLLKQTPALALMVEDE